MGLFDRTKDVKTKRDEKLGMRYTFALVALDGPHKGKLCSLEGGVTLYEGISKQIGTNQAPIKLRFTQQGAKGTTSSRIIVDRA